jgi:predicted small integral membrane protein
MDDARQGSNITNEPHFSHAPRLRRMRQLSKLLDGAIASPGTKHRIGIDPILGLIPGGGDTLSAALSGYIIVEAARMGLPREALMRMVGNLLLDTVVGSVPVVGDVFDVISKANFRNMQIVENHIQTFAPTSSAKTDKLFIGLLIAGLIIFAIAVGGIAVLVWSFVANSFR